MDIDCFLALTWGGYIVGLLSSLFAYLYLRCKSLSVNVEPPSLWVVVAVTDPAYNASGQYTAPVLLFAFLIGLQCCVLFCS